MTIQQLSEGWREVRLGEIIDEIIDNRGKTPPISNRGYELLEVNAIAEGSRLPDYTKVSKFVDEETFKNWFRKGTIKKGDILLPTVGTIGNVSYSNEDRGCIAQNLIALRSKVADSLYLYYLLNNPLTKKRLLNLDIGGVQPSIKVPHLLNLYIHIPPLPEQKAIAAVLSSFDDKIELLQQENQTLEAMGQTLFQEWFGKYSVDKPEELPEGWKVGKLVDVVKFVQGTQVPSEYQIEEYQENYDKFLRIVDYMSNFSEPPRYIPQKDSNTYCDEDEIIMVRYGEVGFVGRRMSGVFANNLFKISPKKPMNNDFLYYFLKSNDIKQYIKNNSAGSALPAIKHSTIGDIEFIMPSKHVLEDFREFAQKIERKVLGNNSEIKSLSHISEELLPKLMLGEIRVNI